MSEEKSESGGGGRLKAGGSADPSEGREPGSGGRGGHRPQPTLTARTAQSLGIWYSFSEVIRKLRQCWGK